MNFIERQLCGQVAAIGYKWDDGIKMIYTYGLAGVCSVGAIYRCQQISAAISWCALVWSSHSRVSFSLQPCLKSTTLSSLLPVDKVLLFNPCLLLYRFSFSENIAGQSQLKSSVQRAVRTKLQDQFPTLEPIMDELIPKKTPIIQIKG